MRTTFLAVLAAILLFSCNNENRTVVDSNYIDSLIENYTTSPVAVTSENNLRFWKRRMDSIPENYVNGPEYAAALSSQFHLRGNINDLLTADSLVEQSIVAYKGNEPGLYRRLAYLAIQQHQFNRADTLLKKVVNIEGQTLPNAFLDFDISFEKGDYRRAKNLLATLKKDNSYGYLFRLSKFEHYDGSLDSSISYMLQAAEIAGNNNYLRQTALSNAADLCLHKGAAKKAYDLFQESINIDAADMHSIMGMGWIALIHDKNDTLANSIFQFVEKHTSSPDILLKFGYVAEQRNDNSLHFKLATEFEEKAANYKYGNMYNKYLIDLYTGILNEPIKAVTIAERELINRSTPQTYAWYVWSLYSNNEKDKAYQYFKSYVSSQPLEGPELYYMGKMMEGLGKGFNAKQFLKAAWKNRYDLSPAKQKELSLMFD